MVLGASGFLGRWVAMALQEHGAILHLIVRSAQVARPIFSQYGISAEAIELDLEDAARTRNLLKRIRPYIVFNLAGYGVDRMERDEHLSFQINASLVTTICESIAPHSNWPGQQVVHAGSALEYGSISGNLAEDTAPCPTTVYGKTKLAGTLALSNYCVKNELRGLTARLFTVYGPGEHEGRLLPSLMAASRSGKPLELTWGTQKRDFTYVRDVAQGLLRLGLSGARPGEIVNLATGCLSSVRSFVETAARVLGIAPSALLWGKIPTRSEEMAHSPVAVDKLRQLTGWVPATGIQEGISAAQQFLDDGVLVHQ